MYERGAHLLAEACLQITFDLPFLLERLAQSQKKREEGRWYVVVSVKDVYMGKGAAFSLRQKSKVKAGHDENVPLSCDSGQRANSNRLKETVFQVVSVGGRGCL